MKAQEMIVGNIYYSNCNGNGWLFKFSRIEGKGVVIKGYARKANIEDKDGIGYCDIKYEGLWGSCKDAEVELREGSLEEVAWFEACEAAGGLVEKPVINYSIY